MKRIGGYSVAIVAVVVLVNILAHCFVVRWDLTDDRRYSISAPTRSLLEHTEGTIIATCYLQGEMNSGFRRLSDAAEDMLTEMRRYADIRVVPSAEEQPAGLQPIVIHERTRNGKTAQTALYPYIDLQLGQRHWLVSLLHNQRGLSGEENLNRSIENLEYALAEGIHSLQQDSVAAIAFLEGHGEPDERYVFSLEQQLSRYFRVDRGTIGDDPTLLDAYRCLVIADPEQPFSDIDRYAIDRFIMRGGRVLWVLNGVRFSNEVLSRSGFTPVIPLDLHLQDLLYQYGVRVNPVLVQDRQCLPIAVNMAPEGQEPNFQPMPWYYAPLLLTSEASPITRNMGQVSATFASVVQAVGGEDGIDKQILLATSDASRLIGTPAEVDLSDMNPDPGLFQYSYLPVAMSLEGIFPSAFRYLEAPEGISHGGEKYTKSKPTRQIVVASGSIIRNEVQQGQALPTGYDRYSGMQFANGDFLTNAILWLTDDEGLIPLRQRHISLRLINDQRARQQLPTIRTVAIALPIILLLLLGALYIPIRKHRYVQ